MRDKAFTRYALEHPGPGFAWRWEWATELAEGDPLAAADCDALTRRAAQFLVNDGDPDLADVATAAAVHSAGGLRRRALQAYLLTTMTVEQVAAATRLSPAAVAAYAALFFDVRGTDRRSRELWARARALDDPLARAARHGGVRRVEGRLRKEGRLIQRAGDAAGEALLQEFFGHDPAEYALAARRAEALKAMRRAQGLA